MGIDDEGGGIEVEVDSAADVEGAAGFEGDGGWGEGEDAGVHFEGEFGGAEVEAFHVDAAFADFGGVDFESADGAEAGVFGEIAGDVELGFVRALEDGVAGEHGGEHGLEVGEVVGEGGVEVVGEVGPGDD